MLNQIPEAQWVSMVEQSSDWNGRTGIAIPPLIGVACTEDFATSRRL